MPSSSKRLGPVRPLWLVVALLLAGCGGDRGLPAQNGIVNFGKVNDNLYRGAQPDAAGIKSLQQLGIKSIINLRKPDEEWATEAAAARASGIVFTNIALKGVGAPTEEQMSKLLSLLATLPAPVFVHCEYGCDRTGTVIACYRIQHDKWTADAAQREANFHGMSRLERGMKEFIREFSKPNPPQ